MLTPEETAKKNNSPEMKAAKAAEKAAAKALSDAEKAAAEQKRIEEDTEKLYLKCEKALGENWDGKPGKTVWVSCKYMKKAAIEEVCTLYKQNKWKCRAKYEDPGDGEGGRYFLVFGE